MKFTIDGREYEDYQLSNEQIVRLIDGKYLEMDDTHVDSDEKEFLMKKVYERFKHECCAKNGETNDDVFARQFSNYVNTCPNNFKKAAITMSKDHRYLQNEMFKVFIEYTKILASNACNGIYDARNQWACKLSEAIVDALDEGHWSY